MILPALAMKLVVLLGASGFQAGAEAQHDSPIKPANDVAIVVNPESIDFRIGKQLITRYNYAPTLAKPYFWPVNSPRGVALTRGWPMQDATPGEATDHVHQKSLWFCHGDVIPEGIQLTQKIKGIEGVDFWSETKGHGTIVCKKVGQPRPDGNQGSIETVNEWLTPDGVKILDEKRTIRLIPQPDYHLLVLDIDLHASVCPITFGDTKEGSLGVRVRQELTEQKGKGKLTNAEGKVGELLGVWGQKSAWCDDSGVVDGEKVGIAILAHPDNPFPTCWHSRAYGLMAANPFGRKKSGFPAMKNETNLVKLAKGDHLRLRYGILLHPGDAKSGKVEEGYQFFRSLK